MKFKIAVMGFVILYVSMCEGQTVQRYAEKSDGGGYRLR